MEKGSYSLIHPGTQADEAPPPGMAILAPTREKRTWRIMEGLLKHYFLQHFISVNIGHVAHPFQEGLGTQSSVCLSQACPEQGEPRGPSQTSLEQVEE